MSFVVTNCYKQLQKTTLSNTDGNGFRQSPAPTTGESGVLHIGEDTIHPRARFVHKKTVISRAYLRRVNNASQIGFYIDVQHMEAM
jgi:hypothetical protein